MFDFYHINVVKRQSFNLNYFSWGKNKSDSEKNLKFELQLCYHATDTECFHQTTVGEAI